MQPIKTKTRKNGPTETIKVAISNLLYMKTEGEPKGIATVFEMAIKHCPELTNKFFDNLLDELRVVKARIEAEEAGKDNGGQFNEAVEE